MQQTSAERDHVHIVCCRFVVFANENAVRDKFGVLGEWNRPVPGTLAGCTAEQHAHAHLLVVSPLSCAECKMCYDYHAQAADTCRSRAHDATCWGAVKLGYCSLTDTLLNKFSMNTTEVRLLARFSQSA
jgi:hypothetical protein